MGNWSTQELQTAVYLGYQVLKIFEVYHWNETTQCNPKNKKEESLPLITIHSLGQIFLFVDLRDFFSDLGSGGRNKINKKNSENDQLIGHFRSFFFRVFFQSFFFFNISRKTVKLVR